VGNCHSIDLHVFLRFFEKNAGCALVRIIDRDTLVQACFVHDAFSVCVFTYKSSCAQVRITSKNRTGAHFAKIEQVRMM
jgi:hypothetical protein